MPNEILEEDHITFKEVWSGKDEEFKTGCKRRMYSKSRLFYRTGISLLHHHRANQ